MRVDTFGTGKVPDPKLATVINRLFDLSPLGIIKELNLRRPLYRQTAHLVFRSAAANPRRLVERLLAHPQVVEVTAPRTPLCEP